MHVADSSGTMREVTAAWVSDGLTWREVDAGWVADSSGVMQEMAPFAEPVVATITPINHVSFRIGWETVSSDSVALKVNGSTVYTSNDDSGSYVVSGRTPTETVSVTAVGTFGSSSYTSDAVLHTLPNIPAPTGVGISGVTTSQMVISWSAVTGAASYEVCNADTGTVLQTTTQLTWTRTGLNAGTLYKMYVKARFDGSIVSSPSSTVQATTTSTFAAGVYTFSPTSCNTWQTNSPQWRGTSSGETWHGDGYPWSSRGVNTAYFFGYKNASAVSLYDFFNTGLTVNVVRVEVYAKRLNTSHGINSPQLCRFWRHQHTTQPTTPATYSTAYDNGTLGRGEAKWIDVPVSWANELIAGTTKGIAWGGTPQSPTGARYMIGPTTSVLSSMMAIRITVA